MEAGSWIREIHPPKSEEVEEEPHDPRLDLPKGTLKLLITFALLETRVDDVV